MSAERLLQGHVEAWRRVYSYPSIARRLAKARVDLPLALTANLGYRFYAYHLDTHYTCDWPIAMRDAA